MSYKISCNIFLINTSRQPFSVMLHINNNNPQSKIFITIDVHVGLSYTSYRLFLLYSNLSVSIVSICLWPVRNKVDRTWSCTVVKRWTIQTYLSFNWLYYCKTTCRILDIFLMFICYDINYDFKGIQWPLIWIELVHWFIHFNWVKSKSCLHIQYLEKTMYTKKTLYTCKLVSMIFLLLLVTV